MSADQQRLNSSIQRISEQSPRLRELLKASDNKGGKASSVGMGVSEAEESRICCDGSTSGNANPGSTENDPDAGGQDDGLNPADPARLNSGEGVLSGVTNCATGEPLCFAGSGFIPPDGWDDPSSPGVLPGWEEGFYWLGSLTNSLSDALPFFTCDQARSYALSICSPSAALPECPLSSQGAYQCDPDETDGETVIRGYAWASRQCSQDFNAEMCQYTEENPPLAEEWPSDGCTNLAIVNGSIVGSKYDPENDGSYSAPVQELEVCDAVTGEPILLRVDTNSTYKSIKSLSGDIDPDTQAGYLYDTNTGQRIRQISPSEFRDPTV